MFLSSSDVRATDNPKYFSCTAMAIGLQRDDFPRLMETDLGNRDPLYLNRSICDAHGYFVGAVYRQSSGCEVSVLVREVAARVGAE
jgi:hypothetical protein